MNPIEFNNLASELVAGNTPAKIRTAISRAYYAVFLIGLELLNGELGFGIPTHKAHKEIKYCLSNSGDTEFKKVSSKFGILQSNRVSADYHPERTGVENLNNAQSLVILAGSIIKTMRADIVEPRRSQIIKSIQDYRRDILGCA